jgi:hypothetical protein
MDEEQLLEMKKQIEALRVQYADLREAFDMEVDNTTMHVKSIYQYIASIHEYLMPVVQRVFPGLAEAKKQLDALVKGYGRSRKGWKRS